MNIIGSILNKCSYIKIDILIKFSVYFHLADLSCADNFDNVAVQFYRFQIKTMAECCSRELDF